MTRDRVRDLLTRVADGTVSPDHVLDDLSKEPFESLDFATIDHHRALRGGGGPLGLLDGLERADRRQDGAGFGFLTGGRAGRVGALWRYVAVVGGSLVEVHVVDKGRLWYGREGHGASLL